MKSRARANEKVEEIKLFVRTSCEGCSDQNSQHLGFHKDIIRHYFEAKNVEISYEKRKITAQIAVGKGYTTLNFNCPDLPTFLSSCIKEDQISLDTYLNYIRIYPMRTAAIEW